MLDAGARAQGRAEVRLVLQLRRRAARPGPAQRDGVPARASGRDAADPRCASRRSPGPSRSSRRGCCRSSRRHRTGSRPTKPTRPRSKPRPRRRPEAEVALEGLRCGDEALAVADARPGAARALASGPGRAPAARRRGRKRAWTAVLDELERARLPRRRARFACERARRAGRTRLRRRGDPRRPRVRGRRGSRGRGGARPARARNASVPSASSGGGAPPPRPLGCWPDAASTRTSWPRSLRQSTDRR